MKGVLVILVFCIVFTAFAVILPELPHYAYPRFIKFPDGEGVLHDVDLEEAPDVELLNEIASNPANNMYLLYTRANSKTAQTLVMNDRNSITSSHFNSRVPTAVTVHGWQSNQNTKFNPIIRDALLGSENVNVIVMDWSRIANSSYVTAADGALAVGRGLGQFLAFLNSVTGAPFKSMHVIGVSLGAHVSGFAGRELGGQLGRITGLNPASPLFINNSNSLNRNDGVYVETINTDGDYAVGGFGIGTAVADADFFPNGGISQPGCLTNSCNHNRAWELFVATVIYNHLVGNKCDNKLQILLNTCRGDELLMGNNILNKWGTGLYRVNTNSAYPF